jgi:hypothetical protein
MLTPFGSHAPAPIAPWGKVHRRIEGTICGNVLCRPQRTRLSRANTPMRGGRLNSLRWGGDHGNPLYWTRPWGTSLPRGSFS